MLHKLESLRGLAACLVVLYHSPFNFEDESISFIANSYLFVDFFFILSGFVMALAYTSKIRKGLGLREYSILRLGRLYPLHFVMLIIWIPYILLKQYLFESGFGGISQLEQNNLTSFISNVFLLNSMGLHQHLSWNPPAWSISTEFWAYIVFFFITAKIDKKESLITPLIISVACYSFILSLDKSNLDITYDYGFFRCLGAFYIGVFIYRVSSCVEIPKSLKRKLLILEFLCIASLIVFVSQAATSFIYFIPIIIIFSLSIIVFSQSESGIFGKALLGRHIRLLGTWSYSIYMTHVIILAVIANFLEYVLKWDINAPLHIYSVILNVASLSVVIIISKYTYTYIEKPFRDKSRVFAMRRQNL